MNELAVQICAAIGIDSTQVYALTLESEVGDFERVTVSRHVLPLQVVDGEFLSVTETWAPLAAATAPTAPVPAPNTPQAPVHPAKRTEAHSNPLDVRAVVDWLKTQNPRCDQCAHCDLMPEGVSVCKAASTAVASPPFTSARPLYVRTDHYCAAFTRKADA